LISLFPQHPAAAGKNKQRPTPTKKKRKKKKEIEPLDAKTLEVELVRTTRDMYYILRGGGGRKSLSRVSLPLKQPFPFLFFCVRAKSEKKRRRFFFFSSSVRVRVISPVTT
jgi:hypothetical protein